MSLRKPIEILSVFANVTDPRLDRRKLHPLAEILFVALCGTLCGCNSWVDVERFGNAKFDWFRRFLRLRHGIASHDTFSRVFGLLKASQLEECFREWLIGLHQASGGDHIAIDGKTLANSLDRASGQSAMHLLSAWSVEAGVVLGQQATDQKSNEITAIPKLLKRLELAGAVVTIDAMGCQKEIARQIHEERADYVLALKGNHPKLHAAVVDALIKVTENDFSGRGVRRTVTRQRSGRRTDVREYVLIPVPKDLPGREEWTGLKSIGVVTRRRLENGTEIGGEVRYYLTSLATKVKRFARIVRRHWNIENSLHWSLDVTFTEDKSRIRAHRGPEVAGWLRRMVVSILKQDTSINASLNGKRLILGWNEVALAQVLTGFRGI